MVLNEVGTPPKPCRGKFSGPKVSILGFVGVKHALPVECMACRGVMVRIRRSVSISFDSFASGMVVHRRMLRFEVQIAWHLMNADRSLGLTSCSGHAGTRVTMYHFCKSKP